jgi:DNA-binding NarL/FixJ family response regulator
VAPDRRTPARARSDPVNTGRSARVVLVDDHEIVRDGCRKLLERHGFEVVWEGGNGEQAYRQIVALAPGLVVVDLSIEGVGGLETIRRIHHHDPDIRVIVFSMHDDPTFATRALHAGAIGYVTKTTPPEILVKAVQTVTAGRSFLSHDIAQALALSDIVVGDDPLARLTDREFEVFELLVDGHSSAQIAGTLSLSAKSVSNYVGRIKQKLGAPSVADLVRIAINSGFAKRNVNP